MLGPGVWSPNRERKAKVKKSKPLEESNAQLQLHYKFLNVQPHTMFREGVIYTLNLITTFQKCPSGFPGDQLVTAGVFGNFFGRTVQFVHWTVQFVHFYLNYMFRDPMWPLESTFELPPGASHRRSWSWTFGQRPEGFLRHLWERGQEWLSQPLGASNSEGSSFLSVLFSQSWWDCLIC